MNVFGKACSKKYKLSKWNAKENDCLGVISPNQSSYLRNQDFSEMLFKTVLGNVVLLLLVVMQPKVHGAKSVVRL